MQRGIFTAWLLWVAICAPLRAESNPEAPKDEVVIWGLRDPNAKPSDPRSRLVGGIRKENVKVNGKAKVGLQNDAATDSQSGDSDANAETTADVTAASETPAPETPKVETATVETRPRVGLQLPPIPTSRPGGQGAAPASTSSAGNGSGSRSNTLTVDDSASRGGPGPVGTGNAGGGTSGSAGARVDTAARPGGSKAEIYDKWWPVCAFLDESISQDVGNKAMKGLVDKAAKCKVNLVVFPFTIKGNYPDSPDVINQNSAAKCNIADSGLATEGSATTLVKYPLTAAKMCESKKPNGEYDENTAGCAELRQGTDTKNKEFKEALQANGGHENMSAASGGVATSIEVPNGWSAFVVSHEAIGHNQMGMPNGSSYGMGIGPPGDKGTEGGGEEWTDSGCAVMRDKAHPNTQKFAWNPEQTSYYVKEQNPQYQFDLLAGPKLFQRPNGPPPGSPPAPPTQIPKEPPRLVYDDNAPRPGTPPGSNGGTSGDRGPASTGNPGAPGGGFNGSTVGADSIPPAAPKTGNLDEKHKQKPADTLLSGVKKDQGKPKTEIAKNEDTDITPSPEVGKAKPATRLGMDDSAAKNGGGSSVGEDPYAADDSSSETSDGIDTGPDPIAPPSPASKGSGSQSLGMDDNAPKNLSGFADLAGSGGAGGKLLGMDDNASKNSAGGGDGAMGSSGVSSVGGDGASPSDPLNKNRGPASGVAGGGILSVSGSGFSDPGFEEGFFDSVGREEGDEESAKDKKRAKGRERKRGAALRVSPVGVKEFKE